MLRVWKDDAGSAEEIDPFAFLRDCRDGAVYRFLVWIDHSRLGLEHQLSFFSLARDLGGWDSFANAVVSCHDPDRAWLHTMAGVGIRTYSLKLPHFGRFPDESEFVEIGEIIKTLCPWFTPTDFDPTCGSAHHRMKVNELKIRSWCLVHRDACPVYREPPERLRPAGSGSR